ncbi:MAG: arsenate reductase (azurin) large subunit [Nannocystales bacterium]
MSRERLGRRRFAKLALATGGAVSMPAAASAEQTAKPNYYIPPTTAKELTSACAFCIVGCGYRIYRWPVDAEPGGLGADENALGVDLPTTGLPWISPNQHNVVEVDGMPHHVVVVPDWKAEVVNVGGDYSLGATLARRLYSRADERKSDRLLRPQLRVAGELVEVSWDEASEIVARLSRHIIDTHSELAWGMKTYSYQFYENTYAITKLAFEKVQTPCWAPHDQPRDGSSTPGLSVAGVDAFSAGYPDWRDADVVFVSGVAIYEARGVLFSNWVRATPSSSPFVDDEGNAQKALVVVNPRRDVAAQWAEDHGGVHLQLKPGTDTVLNNAIARLVVERGWQDDAWIESFVVTEAEFAAEAEANGMREAYGATFDAYRSFLLADETYSLERAAQITGVPAEKIELAASLLAEPRVDETGTVRAPRTSFMLEKGNYWAHNFPGSASLVSLGLVLGAGNRPGRVISRGGGHQRGMMKSASYPKDKSPHSLQGRTAGLNLDQWVLDGNLRMAWVIGCTWAGGGTAGASVLHERVRELVGSPQLAADVISSSGVDIDTVVDTLAARADAGGMILVQQDIYPQALTELADIVLPAASWGEAAFTRMQGERRLRYYAQICDPPGEARTDWQIIADVARRMGYDGFDWATGDEIFEEAGPKSGGTQAYGALVEEAQRQGRPARDLLAERGTEGYQCPIYVEDGRLRETPRFHDAETAEQTAGDRGAFKTASGKAVFAIGDWNDVIDRHESLAPRDGELWVINRRDSRTWSAMIEDRRIAHRIEQMPENTLELNPIDAGAAGIADGDPVRVVGSHGSFSAVAILTDGLQPGVSCAYFNYLGELDTAANNVVSNTTDPINGMFSFKLGRGRIEKA